MRRLKLLMVLSPLLAAAILAAAPASAQLPIRDAVTPYSWPQFKADYGLPSTPTALDDSSQTDTVTTPTGTLPTNYVRPTTGDELRAYLLGDYGSVLPPSGPNNFLDLEAYTGTANPLIDSLVSWIAPEYAGLGSLVPLTVDDDNALNTVTIPPATTATDYGTFALPSGTWTAVGANVDGFTAITPPTGTVTTANYYGDGYFRIQAVQRAANGGGSTATATWTPNITSAGYYSVYAYFPSQNLPATSNGPEPHVSDARYTVQIGGVTEATVLINQQNGGTWIPVAGPYYMAAGANVVVTLDNTSATPTQSLSNGVTTTTVTDYVVANAIQLQASDGNSNRSLGTPVAVNITAPILSGAAYPNGTTAGGSNFSAALQNEIGTVGDYKEIALGYGGPATGTTLGNAAGDAFTGGLPIFYQTGSPISVYQQGTAFNTTTAGTSYVPPTGTLTGTYTISSSTNEQYFAGNVGYEANNGTAAPTNSGTPTEQLASTTQAIDQVVYFTRTEAVSTNPHVAEQSGLYGFLYCVNGMTGDVIWKFPSIAPLQVGASDTTDNDFSTPTGTWNPSNANSGSSFNGETYETTGAQTTAPATATAQWNMPLFPSQSGTAARYFVYVYFPVQGNGEIYVPGAHYQISNGATGAGAATYDCYVNQQTGGGNWVMLTAASGATSFTLIPGSAKVVLGNDDLQVTTTTGVTFAAAGANEVVAADAVEYVPVTSMGQTESTPAIVRNMRVIDPAHPGTYLSRTVVIAADDNGKVFCVDASGNRDGNDNLLDSSGQYVAINSTGQAFQTSSYNSTTGTFTTPAVLPLHVVQYGTTPDYWIWQPNTSNPITQGDLIELFNLGSNAVSESPATGTWSGQTETAPPSYATGPNNEEIAAAATRSGTAYTVASPPPAYFTYAPYIGAANAGLSRVYVWDPGVISGQPHITDADYTVVDGVGNLHFCKPVDQTTTSPGFVLLQDTATLQTAFNFTTVTTPPTTPPYGTANTIVLDNTTNNANAATLTVVADAVKIVFTGASDANSNLIGPLAFQTCSPTVHVVPSSVDGTTTVDTSASATTFDSYDAKVYIGNSNGVLYALDAAGYPDGVNIYQRDFSLDTLTPSPGVDWWFNVGVTAVDANNEIEDNYDNISQGIAGTPAYYSVYGAGTASPNDQILFTTYSPTGSNEGTLYSVYAQGPVGDYGNGPQPNSEVLPLDYRAAAGTSDYNLSPIPYFSFPDAYGSPHVPGTTTSLQSALSAPITYTPPVSVSATSETYVDHLLTSKVAEIGQLIPPAHALGDAAGSPTVFGGISVTNPVTNTAETLPTEAYFAANDPTPDGSTATYGRIWGVNLLTGTVDAGNTSTNGVFYGSYIYPSINPQFIGNTAAAAASFDPNIIPLSDPDIPGTSFDYITGVFNTQETVSSVVSYNTEPFGPFTNGPLQFGNSNLNFFVSSSPATGIIHTIPSTAGTLTDTLTGANGYSPEYGGNPYDVDVPMLYVGDLNGVLHSINIAGSTDNSRFIQDSTLDGSAIISTPALLANGNGANIAGSDTTGTRGGTTGNNVGGVVYVTSQSGNIWESEAFPFIESGLETSAGTADALARNVDWEFGGPGGYSSVAASSFNIDNFYFVGASAGQAPIDTLTGTNSSVDTSEWIYASGDNGYTYGFTADNTSLGNGGANYPGAFQPGGLIPVNAQTPINSVPLNRNILTAVFNTNPLAGATSTSTIPFDSDGIVPADNVSGRPPVNPVFEWGQTAYIVFYGIDDPMSGTTTTTPTSYYPKALTLTFTIKPAGTAANTSVTYTKSIDLQATNAAVLVAGAASGAHQWPPAGYAVSSPNNTATVPEVGPYAVVYAFQLGNGNGGDLQTPGAKIQITNIREQAEYYSNNVLTVANISGGTTGGRVIRSGIDPTTGKASDVAAPPVDEATFSILNPLAIRTSAKTMDATTWYNMALPQDTAITVNQLGPFSGVPDGTAAAQFAIDQPALCNGNSVPESMPIGGTETTGTGAPIDPNNPVGNQLPVTLYTPVIMAVSPGLVGHGTSGNTTTVDTTDIDPDSSNDTQTEAVTPTSPSNSSPGSYGQSMLNIADRSDVGNLEESLSNLRMTDQSLVWQDNSGSGGPLAVVNPLPWDVMPTSSTGNDANKNGSADYPNIGVGNTSAELMARQAQTTTETTPGALATLTTAPGTLANCGTGLSEQTDPTLENRTVFPNATVLNLTVPKYQPANTESYSLTSGKVTHFNSVPANVGQGYIGTYRVYIDSSNNQRRTAQDAFRQVQLWVAVPADLRTAIVEPTIDIGSVPAGFGINLSNSNNASWMPFLTAGSVQNASPLSPFYKPITVENIGNTNLINLHLDQYVNYHGATSVSPEPNAFGSYGVSGLSTIPTYDVPGATTGLLTGTKYQPLLRSSLDDFDGAFDVYEPNSVYTNSYTNNTQPPGPTLHKARPGDAQPTVASVPDVPHNNLGAGSVNLNGLPYGGRPVLSLAIPVGTPVGTYSQTISAFEGFDYTDGTTYTGPYYGSDAFTSNGWLNPGTLSTAAAPTDAPYALDVYSTPTGMGAYQSESTPSTVVKVNVVETRITDGVPLPIANGTIVSNGVLPQVDGGQANGVNKNDLQPCAFYDPTGVGGSPSFALLWTSARNGTQTSPFSLYGSSLPTAADGTNYIDLLNTPASTGAWWSAANQLTELPAPTTFQQSYAASTFGTLSSGAVTDPMNAIYVTETPSATGTQQGATGVGSATYALNEAAITYASGQPTLGTSVTLFSASTPMFSPRASYFYSGANALTGLTPTGYTGVAPLIVYSTKVGGRSALMYWPGENSSGAIAAVAVPMPDGVTSASTPTIVARPVVAGASAGTAVPEIDIVFSGQLGSSANADVLTGRYQVATNANGSVTLTEAPTLPVANASGAVSPLPTTAEPLTAVSGVKTWAARDIAWYRDPVGASFALSITTNLGTLPLVPAYSSTYTTTFPTPVYDRASGQWVFQINWSTLAADFASDAAALTTLENWWFQGATPQNIVVYTNPSTGTVTFSTPPPAANSSAVQFTSMNVSINPQVLRNTFRSQSNTTPIAFIDDQPKPNASPGQPVITTSRYWYIYRKQTSASTNAASSTAVLYFNTRRLTVVLPNPVQLSASATGAYALTTPFDVKDSAGNDVTNDVDVDWARGRIYFPDIYTATPSGGAASKTYSSEGRTFTITYEYSYVNGQSQTATSSPTAFTGTATWQDEPLYNSPNAATVLGEHILPVNAPASESDPCAFLDPLAGSQSSGLLADNPSTATPEALSGQPYPHKVWVFWTSSRNAGASGSGTDLYWETIDPRFEVINP